MCKISKKLLMYDYMIGRLTQWFSKKDNISEDMVLTGWTSTALMKYLYIVCVVSTRNSINKSLFNLYDNFVAFPHGPVEIDTYYNRGILVRYCMSYDKDKDIKYLRKCTSYRNEQIVQYNLNDKDVAEITPDDLLDELIKRNELVDFKKAMEKSIDKLLNAQSLPEFKDTTRLIEITHQILWNEAWASASKQLRLNNEIYMGQERIAIEKAIRLV